MIPLRLNETADLTFTVGLEGTSNQPESRLVLSLREGQEFSIAGSYKDDQVRVSVPALAALEPLMESENVQARLEVLVDGHYFTPWSDSFKIERPVGVKSDLLNEGELKKEPKRMQVKVETATVSTKEQESFESKLRRRLGKAGV